MNDFEKLKKTFDEIGQEYFLSEKAEMERDTQPQHNCVITIKEGAGYSNFFCEFYFLNGKRVGHGVWE